MKLVKEKLQNILDDYGWTAFNQILLGGNLGVSLDYEYFSFINYDIKITDSIIHDLNNPIPFLVSKVKDLRLKDRYLDLRSPIMKKRLTVSHLAA